jgi:hypothetical protein
MKKKRLDVEFSYDFELLGIHCSARGYKLAWEINQALDVQLQKKPDLKIHDKAGEFSFSHFEHQSLVNTLRLFRNKPNESENSVLLLIPEHPTVDYILYSRGDEQMEGKRLHELLRNIPSIEWVAFIPLAALKSKDNFIF